MIKPNPDVPTLSGEAEFYDTLQKAERPVVILFWDGKDEDKMRSMPLGIRWLRNEAETRKYFDFYKIQESDAPQLWKKYSPQGHEMIAFRNEDIIDRFPGFIYASEIGSKLMTHIDKKASLSV